MIRPRLIVSTGKGVTVLLLLFWTLFIPMLMMAEVTADDREGAVRLTNRLSVFLAVDLVAILLLLPACLAPASRAAQPLWLTAALVAFFPFAFAVWAEASLQFSG